MCGDPDVALVFGVGINSRSDNYFEASWLLESLFERALMCRNDVGIFSNKEKRPKRVEKRGCGCIIINDFRALSAQTCMPFVNQYFTASCSVFLRTSSLAVYFM